MFTFTSENWNWLTHAVQIVANELKFFFLVWLFFFLFNRWMQNESKSLNTSIMEFGRTLYLLFSRIFSSFHRFSCLSMQTLPQTTLKIDVDWQADERYHQSHWTSIYKEIFGFFAKNKKWWREIKEEEKEDNNDDEENEKKNIQKQTTNRLHTSHVLTMSILLMD